MSVAIQTCRAHESFDVRDGACTVKSGTHCTVQCFVGSVLVACRLAVFGHFGAFQVAATEALERALEDTQQQLRDAQDALSSQTGVWWFVRETPDACFTAP